MNIELSKKDLELINMAVSAFVGDQSRLEKDFLELSDRIDDMLEALKYDAHKDERRLRDLSPKAQFHVIQKVTKYVDSMAPWDVEYKEVMDGIFDPDTRVCDLIGEDGPVLDEDIMEV